LSAGCWIDCTVGRRPELLSSEVSSDKIAGDLHDAFGNRLYGMLARHYREEEINQEARLRKRAGRYGFPVVASNEVLYHTVARRPLQDVLTAIRPGIPLSSCGRRLKPNAEHGLKSPYAFSRLFANDPLAVARTHEIAERCTFSLSEIRYRYPSEHLPDGTTSMEWLRHLAFTR
jgi:error-prone DNA polymerase